MASHKGVRFATKIVVAAGLVTVAATCGGDGPTPPSGPASLNITPTDLRLVRIGDTARVTATPKDASGKPVTADISWSSSSAAVATVEGQGNSALVTARGFGTATITASAGSATQAINVRVEQLQFNVNAEEGCTNPIMRTARFEAQSAHLTIFSDTSNPPGGFATADYEAFATKFEELVWPVLTQNFGTPADIDNNGRVIAFFTKAVNELTPAGSQSVVGGFFYGRDLFPKTPEGRFSQGCPSSNEAEMFYMLVPDPQGVVNGNVRTVDQVRRGTVGVIGHEFQHLINSSRRLFVNTTALYPETDYMEEGLSHIGEELLFYTESGLAPKMNISIDTLRATQQRLDAVNTYQISNLARFRNYLRSPSGNSPYQRDQGGPDLETRGAAWSWLRYLADRPALVTASPGCGQPVSLDPRTTCLLEGAGAAQFDVAAGSNAGEFTIVAFASGAAVTAAASATAAVAVTGPPNPAISAGGAGFALLDGSGPATFSASNLVLDHTFHVKLRQRELRELRELVPYARARFGRGQTTKPSRLSSPGFSAPSGPSFASTPFVEPVWTRLVNSPDTGFKNLQGVFGQDLLTPTRDWAVAHYTDDAVFRVLDQYTHPSWHFRSVLPIINSDVYPLQTLSLTSEHTVALVNGGAAYLRLGVAAGTTSTVRFTVNGAAPPANLKLVVVRTK